ncbi:MAG: hypothetical protein P4L90_10165 [Rhodopila sp.]|nr:hypothetical protein [Rhodopila sp.]
MRKFIPRDPTAPKRALHTTGLTLIDEDGRYQSTMNLRGKLARSGEMLDRKLQVVCGHCNGGWMSRLQKRAKPYLVPRIQSNWAQPLDESGQRAIAAWATMFAMVVEQADPDTIAISQRDRTALMLGSEPLPGWLIFLGRNRGVPGKFYHLTAAIGDDGLKAMNTHVTTFTVGGVLLQTMSSQVNYYETSGFSKTGTEQYADKLGLCRLWPPLSSRVGMPTRVWSDQDFVLLGSIMERAGLFGKGPSGLHQAIASGQFDPTYTGYRR